MPPCGLPRRATSLAAGLGLALLVTLASLPLVRRLQVPPAVRTVAVGRLWKTPGGDRPPTRDAA